MWSFYFDGRKQLLQNAKDLFYYQRKDTEQASLTPPHLWAVLPPRNPLPSLRCAFQCCVYFYSFQFIGNMYFCHRNENRRMWKRFLAWFLDVFTQYTWRRGIARCIQWLQSPPPYYLKPFKTRYFNGVVVWWAAAQFKCSKALNQRWMLDLAIN